MESQTQEAKRALVLMASEKWTGWCCERCGWGQALPESSEERDALARQIHRLFEEHSCEATLRKIPRTNA